ncbi:MAG: hypothetical protein ACJA08_003209 [Cyclobacteriaceae bacterium]|jgi:hypothetical protein
MIRLGNRSKILSTVLLILLSISCKKNKPALLISDGTIFKPKEYFPNFSWSTTPMYYMFGETERVLSTEEVKFIAERTDFLCIEKSHGLNELGTAELGAKHESAAFKKIKPDIKVLYYFNSAYAWPYTSYNQNFTPEKINDHPELKKFLILDSETGELAYRDHYIQLVYFFDVLNPEFRKWWVETVAKGVEESGCDGAFIDQMHGFFFLREEKKEEVLKAQGELFKELKKKLGPGKIVLGNNANDDIAKDVYPHIDATMFEHYSSKLTTKENLMKEWDDLLKNAKQGKISIFRFGFEHEIDIPDRTDKKSYSKEMEKLAKENLEFYLASFLIGAQPYSYFQYGWGWNLSDGSLVDHPNLLKPLGAPKGAYKRTDPQGWDFTREFEHASVWINTDSRESKIIWK